MKNHTNHGSPRPLNYQRPAISESVVKSVPKQAEPPTRRGAYQGQMPALRPNIHAEGPDLFLNVPVAKSTTPTGPSRKEALDRAFAKALGVPQVPLRKEQPQPVPGMPPQQMPGQGQQPQQGQAPGQPPGQSQIAPPKVPGVNQMAPASLQQGGAPQGMPQEGAAQPMAMTPQGQPIYGDPFHPAHGNFQKPEHQMAANQHQSQAGMGPPQMAMQHQQAAQAHSQMAQDAQSPMDRAAEKFGGSGGQAPGGVGAPPPQGMGAPQGKPPAPPQALAKPTPPPMGQQAPQPGQPQAGPPAAQMQASPGNPPMGTPQGKPSFGDEAEQGDQSKPGAEHPDGTPRESPKPGMHLEGQGQGQEAGQQQLQQQGQPQQQGQGQGQSHAGMPPGAAQLLQNPETMRLFEQFLQSIQAPKGPNPGSLTVQQDNGAPRSPKAVGPESPNTHAGNQKTKPEDQAEKSLAEAFGWV